MNPIYKFELSANGVTRRACPNYSDDLAKEYEKEQNEEFYRAKLSGKLTFMTDDYAFIMSSAFDTRFSIKIFISYDAGAAWSEYWSGRFWKTDCEIDEDAETIKVGPEVYDEYTDVLAGLENEYDLLDLQPEIEQLTVTKRPMIQVYVPGQTVMGCFLSGMYWEQECEAIDDENALVKKYYFAKCAGRRLIEIDGNSSPALPVVFTGNAGSWSLSKDGYRVLYTYDPNVDPIESTWTIVRLSDNKVLWKLDQPGVAPPTPPYKVTLSPADSEATGEVTLYVHDIAVYSRYITDSDTVGSLSTYALPAEDIAENNRNYKRVIGYAFSDVIYFSDRLTSTPTKWGILQPGQYYQQPYALGVPEFFPVAKSAWGRVSIWFAFSAVDWLTEQMGRKEYTLRDAFPLHSVISVLLAKFSSVAHEGTTDYSQFLYGVNPLTGADYRLYLTPKSNILAGNYDQPAQKAPITLRRVLDMLRDCFRCYWFIDDGKLRIEHIEWFRRGGVYSGAPVIGRDLTTEVVKRNGKNWAFAREQYSFDKPEMPARYQFGWMDDVTGIFEGEPIEMVSGYVQAGQVDDINIANFTSDVDYMLLSPSTCSSDGFALLGAVAENLIAPDSSAKAVSKGVFDPVYDIPDIVGKTVTIRFTQTNQNDMEPLVELAFLDSNSKSVSRIMGWSDAGGQKEATAIVPDGAKKIGFRQLTRFETCAVRLEYMSVGRKLPILQYGKDQYIQNGYMSFTYLQQFYLYDMPAKTVRVNGTEQQAYGVKKLKTQQLKFPCYIDPEMTELIRTTLGSGKISKLSINLSSRIGNGTLKYDTE